MNPPDIRYEVTQNAENTNPNSTALTSPRGGTFLHSPPDGIPRHPRAMLHSTPVPNHLNQATQIREPLQQDVHHHVLSNRNSTSSVRHLTCFWWKEKGKCRFSDNECLYAHHDTGHYTEPPRQLIPGEPAIAGRKLDRAMRNVHIVHRSTGSIPSMAGARVDPRLGSHSATPNLDKVSSLNTLPMTAPLVPAAQALVPAAMTPKIAALSPTTHSDVEIVRLNSDNHFLRTLINQGSKEKTLMLNTIESLQAENQKCKSEVENLRILQDQLLRECEIMSARLKQLEIYHSPPRPPPPPPLPPTQQQQQPQHPQLQSFQIIQPLRPLLLDQEQPPPQQQQQHFPLSQQLPLQPLPPQTLPRPIVHPFGPIGRPRPRTNTESHYIGGLLDDEEQD